MGAKVSDNPSKVSVLMHHMYAYTNHHNLPVMATPLKNCLGNEFNQG